MPIVPCRACCGSPGCEGRAGTVQSGTATHSKTAVNDRGYGTVVVFAIRDRGKRRAMLAKPAAACMRRSPFRASHSGAALRLAAQFTGRASGDAVAAGGDRGELPRSRAGRARPERSRCSGGAQVISSSAPAGRKRLTPAGAGLPRPPSRRPGPHLPWRARHRPMVVSAGSGRSVAVGCVVSCGSGTGCNLKGAADVMKNEPAWGRVKGAR